MQNGETDPITSNNEIKRNISSSFKKSEKFAAKVDQMRRESLVRAESKSNALEGDQNNKEA